MLHLTGISIAGAKGAPRQHLAQAQLGHDGLEGDRFARPGLRQLSLLAESTARQFAEATGRAFSPGVAKENLLIAGLETLPLRLLDRIQIGKALLEITAVGKHAGEDGMPLCAPDAACAMGNYGHFARVVQPGLLQVTAACEYLPRTLRVRIVTLSDRASRGAYQDVSGPRAAELIEGFGARHGWRIEVEREIIQDDAELLEAILVQARQVRVDLVITSGGTGMGPRDITPDVVRQHADRLIPGIMEHIRLKYGAEKPLALLSRSVAAIFGRTLVFALPGSPRAVEEYLHEIEPVLEHLLFVVRGLDVH